VHERIQFINHQKKLILLVDFSNCPPEEVEKISRAVPDYVTTQPLSSVLVLSDFTGTVFDGDAIRAIKETAVFDKPYVKKSALVGGVHLSEDLGQKLRDFSRRKFTTVKSRQEALTWLIEE
jgi:hypothetical protein